MTNEHIKDKFWMSEFSDCKVLIRFSCPLLFPVPSRFRSVISNLGLKPLSSSSSFPRDPAACASVCLRSTRYLYVFSELIRGRWKCLCVKMWSVCVSFLCVCVSVLLHQAISQPPTESDTYTVRREGAVSPLFFFSFDKHMSTNA